jgi:hypothetical protein
MNITNPYLYEKLGQDHRQQMRRQISINRLILDQERGTVLQWTANLLLRVGMALQRYREQQLVRVQTRSQMDTSMLKEYHLSR